MRILAIANAHALAHVSRLLEISKVLRDRGHEIIFCGTGKYLEVATMDNFPIRELPYISINQIIEAVRSNKLGQLYPIAQLETFVTAELELYQELLPDLILIDNRPTARTSADKAGIKTVAVLNVHMSPYRKIPFNSLASKLGKPNNILLSIVDNIENKIEYFFYDRIVMGGLNTLRRQLGLKKYFANQHEAGDLSLLCDVPEFNPIHSPLPVNVQFIGPLTWHNKIPPPNCLQHLDKDRKTVYFSLGSESLEELLSQLGVLTQQGVQVVVACGKTEGNLNLPSSPHVYLEEYINTDELLPYCNAVCCHGGNGTLYQALAFGLPIVAVATHAEQNIGAQRIQNLGLGRALTLKELNKKGMEHLVQLMQIVLSDVEIQKNTQQFAKILSKWHGAKTAADEIERFTKLN